MEIEIPQYVHQEGSIQQAWTDDLPLSYVPLSNFNRTDIVTYGRIMVTYPDVTFRSS